MNQTVGFICKYLYVEKMYELCLSSIVLIHLNVMQVGSSIIRIQ